MLLSLTLLKNVEPDGDICENVEFNVLLSAASVSSKSFRNSIPLTALMMYPYFLLAVVLLDFAGGRFVAFSPKVQSCLLGLHYHHIQVLQQYHFSLRTIPSDFLPHHQFGESPLSKKVETAVSQVVPACYHSDAGCLVYVS